MSIICRIGFCEICANIQSPKSGQMFLAFGSTSNEYKILEAQHAGRIGFVPHLYKIEKLGNKNTITVLKSCAMYGCGVERKQEGSNWFYHVLEWKKETWLLESWNALVFLKHNQFTKMYEI